jgi:dTDP-4-dehydrorhamnose reductase
LARSRGIADLWTDVMRILVTGVTGQVGGALVERLQSLGSIVAADRAMLDLARPDEIPAALDRIAPDLILNPAAYTAVDRAEDERALAFRVNGEAPGALARWAAGRATPLVHFSTDYVFDGAGSRPWREDDPTDPLSVYGASKLAGEEAVRGAGGPHLVIRTSWVYAARGTNFLRTIARLARERAELRIVADQFGAPTSARLIAAAVADIVAMPGAALAERFAAAGGLVNLAAAGETSWHGFATAIVGGLKARGVVPAAERITPIAAADYSTKARRPANSRFDLTRLKQVFRIETPHWENALAPELDRLAYELRGR